MSEYALTDPTPTHGVGQTKTRVLELLRAADAPVAVAEVADRTGLHANTARFHLEGLVEAGLAGRSREEAGKPGRPRMVYHATADGPDENRRSYRLLAEMLTSMVTMEMDQPARAAVAAGREWGRYLVERPHPAQRVDLADALGRLQRVLHDAGFVTDPVTRDGEDAVLAIRGCPFREIAEQHQDVVCSLHLGLMEGAADEARAPVNTAALEPFASPSLCLARLRSTA
jgi:predicted ArsR family transcriptional regulator